MKLQTIQLYTMLPATIGSQTRELQIINMSVISDVEEKLVQATSLSMFSTQQTFQQSFFPL